SRWPGVSLMKPNGAAFRSRAPSSDRSRSCGSRCVGWPASSGAHTFGTTRSKATDEKTGGAPVFSSVAFDLVVPNVWAPLLAGHPTHLLPQDLDLSELGARLRKAAPFGFIKLTPGHLD